MDRAEDSEKSIGTKILSIAIILKSRLASEETGTKAFFRSERFFGLCQRA